jgi:cytosine/adenosine deaminase-related metal-dependent hydrolase
MPELSNVLVLHDHNLDVRLCTRFVWDDLSGRITHLEFANDDDYNLKFISAQTNRVLIPAFVNGHTHIGDSCLADGATGLTLEQGFFRPNGFKYIELAKHSNEQLVDAMRDTMNYMLSTGTIMHWDFREQGIHGLHLIREAEKQVCGMKSIVLSQFDRIPFEEKDLDKNEDLPDEWKFELENLWNSNNNDNDADGFSESTMNDLTDRSWISIRDISYKYNNKLRSIHCLENDTYRNISMTRTNGRQSDLQRAFELYDPDIIVHLTEAIQSDIDVIIEQNETNR